LNQIAAEKQIGKTAKTFADKGQKTIRITRLLKEKANIVKCFIIYNVLKHETSELWENSRII